MVWPASRATGGLFRLALCVAMVAMACGAAGSERLVVEPRTLAEATAAPRITRVIDLGGGDVLLDQPLETTASDGVALVGETLWIRGQSFGRQPTVQIAGRPAAVIARTKDGGIVIRVPPGSSVGQQPLVVTTRAGRSETTLTIHRYAAMLIPGRAQIDWLKVSGDGVTSADTTEANGATFMALSHDGRAAYLIGPTGGHLTAIEIPGPGSPRPVFHLDVGKQPVRFMLTAERAPVMAIVREQDILLLDTRSALRPARRSPRPLPDTVGQTGLAAAALSPDGRHLALALGQNNRIVLLDIARIIKNQDAVLAALDVEPDARAPSLVDLAFSPDGGTLWILTGQTEANQKLGPRPTRVHAVRIEPNHPAPTLVLGRSVDVEAKQPLHIVTARGLPMASGAAIRPPPERASVFFSVAGGGRRPGEVFALGDGDAATSLARVRGFALALATEPEGRWLLFASASEGTRAVNVNTKRIDGRPGDASSLMLSKAAPVSTTVPALHPRAVVLVQP